MDLWTAIVLVTLISAVFVIVLVRYNMADHKLRHLKPENDRLHQEVRAMSERLQVLERIVTDRSTQLGAEIDRLRDAPVN